MCPPSAVANNARLLIKLRSFGHESQSPSVLYKFFPVALFKVSEVWFIFYFYQILHEVYPLCIIASLRKLFRINGITIVVFGLSRSIINDEHILNVGVAFLFYFLQNFSIVKALVIVNIPLVIY